ncbi:MAG TPA: penicillin acylase family protein [Mycobacteriales bacterium]|nr:penicillin acylase family protein [Mycobacteriales bacterium]
MHVRRLAVTAAAAAALVLPLAVPGHAAAPSRTSAPAAALKYDVTITRTENGTPHILAKDWKSLGYGYGYAFAQDNICVMADDYVTVDAQRSYFFGPNGTYSQRGNSTTPNNLNSDVFWQGVIDDKRVTKLAALPPPQGPKPELKMLAAGYVAGYNRYLADVGGSQGVTDPTCQGKPWVRPITIDTAYRRFYQLQLLASQSVAIDGIGSATPPSPTQPAGSTLPTGDPAQVAGQLADTFKTLAIGSNAVAVGKAGTADKTHGLLLGNPHFPWLGTERFYQAQLTIPGVVNVEGASLYGVPLVLIGHTDSVAWSHTVSTAFRFTPYQLTLVPGSPTSYLYDGKVMPMTSQTVTVHTSPTKTVTRKLWYTKFGPVFTTLEGIPLPWTDATAFTMRDGNANGLGLLVNHFFDVDRAQSTLQVLDILKKYQGIPWVNTIVSDRNGQALYADIGSIPNVPDDLAHSCDTALGAATFLALGLPVLDGSRSACEWRNDPDATQPGHFGPSHMPYLLRDDYVTNSNDSYWLANPKQPLTGFARIIGDTDTARALRTRIGLIMTQDIVDHGGFTRQKMQDMVFSDRQYAAELTRDALVGVCDSMLGVAPSTSSGAVPLGNACTVLAQWDLKEDPDSRGALLWRRWWAHVIVSAAVKTVQPWLTPFSSSDPVHTPNTLNVALPLVRTALGDAIVDLDNAHIALDAPLSVAQYSTKDGEKIPIPGGPGTYGDFNAINVVWNPTTGYAEPPHGSSYVQVVTWHDATGCPDVATILTYSLSSNPASPYYADQTKMFSKKQWATERFCADTIAAHTVSSKRLTSSSVSGSTPATEPPKRPTVTPPGGSLAATGLDATLGGVALSLLGGAFVARRRTRV